MKSTAVPYSTDTRRSVRIDINEVITVVSEPYSNKEGTVCVTALTTTGILVEFSTKWLESDKRIEL